ncbi:MAG: chromate transporter [Caulobacteraceae bacterium]
MKSLSDTVATLAAQFAILSLLAFGGANAVIPEIHRQSVEVHRWMSDKDFAALFALAQAAPGPNFMISTLVGWKAAGLAGAMVATVAFAGPSCLLAFFAVRLWDRHRAAPWRATLLAGLAPVTVGLVAASAWLLARAADANWRLAAVTAATAAVALVTRLNPLWFLGTAAVLGLAGAFS